VSWAAALVTVFSAVLGLSLHFYQLALEVLICLYETLVVLPNPTALDELCKKIDRYEDNALGPCLVT
jgi:hypothetical protein